MLLGWKGCYRHSLPDLLLPPVMAEQYLWEKVLGVGGKEKEIRECKLIWYHSYKKNNNQLHFHLPEALLYLVGKNEKVKDIIWNYRSSNLSSLRLSVGDTVLKLLIFLNLSILIEGKFLL